MPLEVSEIGAFNLQNWYIRPSIAFVGVNQFEYNFYCSRSQNFGPLGVFKVHPFHLFLLAISFKNNIIFYEQGPKFRSP